LILKLKLVLHTCFTRIIAIQNRINRTLEQSRAQICAQKY
jgi:hypothetical protein